MTDLDTIFGKIVRGEAQADKVYEDDHCLAFRDMFPAAPIHILLIPKKAIPRLMDSTLDDQSLLGHLMLMAPKIAAEQGIADRFRLVVNNGAEAGQSVFHLHLHILGGRELKWPPC